MEHASPLRFDRARQRLAPWAAPLAASFLVLFWVTFLGNLNPAQFSDSIEQYNWAHSLQWGYWKHPPLATWMMRGAIALVGVSHWTARILAAGCLIGSIWFLWQLARMILPARAADLAVLLWPLHQALSMRADVFNHNTALVLLCTATAWAAARAATRGRTRDWILAGTLAGLALLTKYQALVTIVGVVLALWRSGTLHSPRTRRQFALAAVIASFVFLPHVVWLLAQDWTTLHYLERSAPHLEPIERVPRLASYLVTQLGMLTVMLLTAAYAGLGRQAAQAPAAGDAPADRLARDWLLGLVVVPLVVLALSVLVAGLTPQKMWGIHTELFLPLWLAWCIARARPNGPVLARAAKAAAVLTLVAAVYADVETTRPGAHPRIHSVDRLMPAEELAHSVLADWHRTTACPLRLVSGSAFAAGLVSVYSGEYPAVLEDGDFGKSPWVDPLELEDIGYVEVRGPVPLADVPPGVPRLPVPAPAKMHVDHAAIWWRVTPPDMPCARLLAPGQP